MRRLLPSLPIAAALLLAGCASRFEVMDAEPVASRSPLELLGVEVLSSTGRQVGSVEDVVLGPNRRPEHIVVRVGAPMTLDRRRVAVRVDEGRYSAPQNAVVLNRDLTPEQVASRPDLGIDDNMVALGRVLGSGREPTNWRPATVR